VSVLKAKVKKTATSVRRFFVFDQKTTSIHTGYTVVLVISACRLLNCVIVEEWMHELKDSTFELQRIRRKEYELIRRKWMHEHHKDSMPHRTFVLLMLKNNCLGCCGLRKKTKKDEMELGVSLEQQSVKKARRMIRAIEEKQMMIFVSGGEEKTRFFYNPNQNEPKNKSTVRSGGPRF